MKNRRDFLKSAAAGAVLIGAESKLGLAAPPAKSKVVVARDAALPHTLEIRRAEGGIRAGASPQPKTR